MYQQTYPQNITSLLADTASFAELAGFSVIVNDAVTLKYSATFNMISIGGMAGSGYVMASGLPHTTAPANNADISCGRIVLKDPAANTYVHMLGYATGTANRDGVIQPITVIDFYMSTGWAGPGAVDSGHENLIKLGPLWNLPESFNNARFYGGTNSAGAAYVHAVIEESSRVFMQFSFGSLEKVVDFTGGQYITFSFLPALSSPQASTGVAQYAFCSQFSTSTPPSHPGVYGASIYAPDLDTPNQRPIKNTPYRNLSGETADRATGTSIIDYGSSSIYITKSGGIPPTGITRGGWLSQSILPLPNSWTGVSPLLPIFAIAHDGNDRNYHNIIGHFPGVRHLNIVNINPGDEYTLGADIWDLFPVRAKVAELAAHTYTLNHGLAFKK